MCVVITLSLYAGFSSMDEATALFLLRSITEHFISIATEQARSIPDMEGEDTPSFDNKCNFHFLKYRMSDC